MKQAELFGMLLKVLGVWWVVSALQQMPQIFGISSQAGSMQAVLEMLLFNALIIIPFLAGLFLIVGGDWTARRLQRVPPGAQVDGELSRADQFEVFVKTLGLWQLVEGVASLLTVLAANYGGSGMEDPFGNPNWWLLLNPLTPAVVKTIAGGFLLFATAWVKGVAYPQRARQQTTEMATTSKPA